MVEIGDVVRFNRYSPDGNQKWNVAGFSLWGLVHATGVDTFDAYYLGGGEITPDPDPDPDDEPWEWPTSLYANADDKYEVIPPEDWPDDVVVAVARYKLLGEVNE
jgi:hypothetical protein